ncbi:hypothetical protein CLF_102928 [Clonorchis sinensis]|uniref:Uncharacterized protein n=1 Tax=Clonorchis sinensis TaxID=79923 RepID=G7Y8T0_CLOSI|nr:hypothetical protein CLF_102928 [Clonorchis sinensis]
MPTDISYVRPTSSPSLSNESLIKASKASTLQSKRWVHRSGLCYPNEKQQTCYQSSCRKNRSNHQSDLFDAIHFNRTKTKANFCGNWLIIHEIPLRMTTSTLQSKRWVHRSGLCYPNEKQQTCYQSSCRKNRSNHQSDLFDAIHFNRTKTKANFCGNWLIIHEIPLRMTRPLLSPLRIRQSLREMVSRYLEKLHYATNEYTLPVARLLMVLFGTITTTEMVGILKELEVVIRPEIDGKQYTKVVNGGKEEQSADCGLVYPLRLVKFGHRFRSPASNRFPTPSVHKQSESEMQLWSKWNDVRVSNYVQVESRGPQKAKRGDLIALSLTSRFHSNTSQATIRQQRMNDAKILVTAGIRLIPEFTTSFTSFAPFRFFVVFIPLPNNSYTRMSDSDHNSSFEVVEEESYPTTFINEENFLRCLNPSTLITIEAYCWVTLFQYPLFNLRLLLESSIETIGHDRLNGTESDGIWNVCVCSHAVGPDKIDTVSTPDTSENSERSWVKAPSITGTQTELGISKDASPFTDSTDVLQGSNSDMRTSDVGINVNCLPLTRSNYPDNALVLHAPLRTERAKLPYRRTRKRPGKQLSLSEPHEPQALPVIAVTRGSHGCMAVAHRKSVTEPVTALLYTTFRQSIAHICLFALGKQAYAYTFCLLDRVLLRSSLRTFRYVHFLGTELRQEYEKHAEQDAKSRALILDLQKERHQLLNDPDKCTFVLVYTIRFRQVHECEVVIDDIAIVKAATSTTFFFHSSTSRTFTLDLQIQLERQASRETQARETILELQTERMKLMDSRKKDESYDTQNKCTCSEFSLQIHIEDHSGNRNDCLKLSDRRHSRNTVFHLRHISQSEYFPSDCEFRTQAVSSAKLNDHRSGTVKLNCKELKARNALLEKQLKETRDVVSSFDLMVTDRKSALFSYGSYRTECDSFGVFQIHWEV